MDAVISQDQQRRSVQWKTWAGRVIAAIPMLGLTMSAAMKLSHAPALMESMGKRARSPSSPVTMEWRP
jgi:hypothetical protein